MRTGELAERRLPGPFLCRSGGRRSAARAAARAAARVRGRLDVDGVHRDRDPVLVVPLDTDDDVLDHLAAREVRGGLLGDAVVELSRVVRQPAELEVLAGIKPGGFVSGVDEGLLGIVELIVLRCDDELTMSKATRSRGAGTPLSLHPSER